MQEIMIRSTDNLRRRIAPVGGQGGVTVSYLCPNSIQQFHFGKLHLVGHWEKKAQQLVVRDLWRNVQLEATKQALVVQTGGIIN